MALVDQEPAPVDADLGPVLGSYRLRIRWWAVAAIRLIDDGPDFRKLFAILKHPHRVTHNIDANAAAGPHVVPDNGSVGVDLADKALFDVPMSGGAAAVARKLAQGVWIGKRELVCLPDIRRLLLQIFAKLRYGGKIESCAACTTTRQD